MNKMNIIKVFNITMVTLFLSNAYAQLDEVCPTTAQCVSGGAAVAAGAAGGVISHGRFAEARKITNANMQGILKTTTWSKDLIPAKVNGIVNPLGDGDRVLIDFEYTEAESRVIIADRLESEAQTARNQADYHFQASAEALRQTKDIKNAYGVVINTVSDPDYYESDRQNRLARDELDKQRRLENQAHRVRSGYEKIELVKETKDFDSDSGAKASTKEFLEHRVAKGGRIFSVKRVPEAIAKVVRRTRTVGGVVAGAAVVGATLGVAEIVTGAATRRLNEITGGAGRTYYNGGRN